MSGRKHYIAELLEVNPGNRKQVYCSYFRKDKNGKSILTWVLVLSSYYVSELFDKTDEERIYRKLELFNKYAYLDKSLLSHVIYVFDQTNKIEYKPEEYFSHQTDWKSKLLNTRYPLVESLAFYRDIFGKDYLQESGLSNYNDGKTNAIALELIPTDGKKPLLKRYTITNDMDTLDELLSHETFILMSPISYVGKSRVSDNARFLYAIAVDLDGVDQSSYLIDLLYQIDNEVLPRPTYVTNSGNGLHLYYVLEKPIPLFKNTIQELQRYKNRLTRQIWNRYTTSLYDNIQVQSLFQGFRIVGGATKATINGLKSNERVTAYKVGDKVSVDYLNGFSFVGDENKIRHYTYFNDTPLAVAKEKWPIWYQNRVIEGKPKGHWTTKRDLYDWWLNRIKSETTVGHRYYTIMCLSIYAKKAGISAEELERDAFDLVDHFEELTVDDNNHFTQEDVAAALELYNDSYYTFPIDTISKLTAIPIQKNKRNYRNQKQHMEIISAIRDIVKPDWRNMKGRPSKKIMIAEYIMKHPDASKYRIAKDLAIDKKTVYKWYDWAVNSVKEGRILNLSKPKPKDKEIDWEKSIELMTPNPEDYL